MGFFDNTEEGFNKAGQILERGAAALTNRLPEYDQAQQSMKLRQLEAFKKINEELQTMALSGEPPEVVGPKLKQMQTISKGLGVPISDELINHYTNNSLSLGMSFDSDLLADLSPEEQRQLLPLIAQAQRPGPRQKELLDRLDGVRTVKLAQKITQKMAEKKQAHLRITGEELGDFEAYRDTLKEMPVYLQNGKNLVLAMDIVEKRPDVRMALKQKEAEIKTENRSPSVGTDREALAQELGFKSFAEAPADKKKEINTEVKRREDERLKLTEKTQTRLAAQNEQNIAMQARRADISEDRLRLQEEQQKRLLPSQQKILTGNRTAIKAIDDYAQGYEEFIKESKGSTLSDVFRGAIAKNKNAQRAADLVTAQGRSPAEVKLAAKYNGLVGNIRSLTDEVGVLTDIDAIRIMGSFDPSLDRAQVRANLAARRKTHERTISTALEDYQAIGKDVSKFMGKASSSGGIQRATSKSGKPIISRDGGKTWEYE